MDVTAIKIIGTILLWICIVVFGLLPLKVRHFKTNKTLLAISNCFSGGLFIAIGLIHILPEAHEKLEGRVTPDKLKEEEYVFPLSYVICLATFSFILLIDKVIFNNEDIAQIDEHTQIDLHKSIFKHNMEENDPEENFKELVSSNYKVALRLSMMRNKSENLLDREEYNNIEDERQDNVEEQIEDQKSNLVKDVEQKKSVHSKFHNVFNDENVEIKVNNVEHHHSHHHKHDHKDHKPHKHDSHAGHQHRMVKAEDSGLTAYILLLAMGIHGFFAGIAFGVSDTEGEAINMFIAMIAHKWSEALTVGVSFVSAEIDIKRSTYMILFLSAITPFGVFVGYLISKMSEFVIGIALAISAGTFIYISCAEIIVEEFAISKHKFPKFIAYLAGIVFIGYVGTLEG